MDIVVKSVLEYIQSLEGHKNTVLAGGAPRDMLLGLEPCDYDFVIPSSNNRDIHRLAQTINHEFNVVDMVCKTAEYEDDRRGRKSKSIFAKSSSHSSKLTCVYGFSIEGKKIDLIGHKQEDDEEFPERVIKDFDFGINMIYDNGSYICDDNEDFKRDIEYREMTLINLPSISELPKFIKRYDKLNNRYKAHTGVDLRFSAKYLEINKPNEVRKPNLYSDLYNYTYQGVPLPPSQPQAYTQATIATWSQEDDLVFNEVESDEPSF